MKTKLVLAVVALLILFGWLRSSGGGASVEDGSFLLYRQGEVSVRLTFHHTGGNDFRTHVEITYGDGETEVSESMPGHGETVDNRMRTASGMVFELGSFGPLWVAPRQLKEGGSAYGARVEEVRSFNGREAGVVTASVGIGGALRGEWYYDTATGFLLGGQLGTALSNEPQRFELVGSSVPGVVIP